MECKGASLNFRGPSFDLASKLVMTIEEYITKLIYFRNCDSNVLRSSATVFLMSTSKAKEVGQTSLTIIDEFSKVFPIQVKEYEEVIAKLAPIIGGLVTTFNHAHSELGSALTNYMINFVECQTTDCRKKFDYTPVIMQYQQFMNTATSISDTLLNSDEATVENYEAVTVLCLAFHYLTISVQGINSCVQDVLYRDNGFIPQPLQLLTQPLQHVLLEFAEGVSAVQFPFTDNIRQLPTILANLTMTLNAAIREVLGIITGVASEAGKIAQNLLTLRRANNILNSSAKNGLINAVRGVIGK